MHVNVILFDAIDRRVCIETGCTPVQTIAAFTWSTRNVISER